MVLTVMNVHLKIFLSPVACKIQGHKEALINDGKEKISINVHNL